MAPGGDMADRRGMTRTSVEGCDPMPNPRHEQFALLVAKGVPAAEAYRKAGYAETASSNSNAARLMASDSIGARVAFLTSELQAAARAAATVDAQRIQRELEAVALSDIGALFEEGERDGVAVARVLPITRWPEQARRAVSSVKVKRYLEGSGDDAREVETVEFRLWPKVEGIKQLREHMGLGESEDPKNKELVVRVVREGRTK